MPPQSDNLESAIQDLVTSGSDEHVDVLTGAIREWEAELMFNRLDVFGHGKVPMATLVGRLANSDMGDRLKFSGILPLQRIVERLESFPSYDHTIKSELERTVTLDQKAWSEILLGHQDGYDKAWKFLKIFPPNPKIEAEKQEFLQVKAVQEEREEIIRANQSLVKKIQGCLTTIDEKDDLIEQLRQELRDEKAAAETAARIARETLKFELEAQQGRHDVEQQALMAVIRVAETLKLQLTAELKAKDDEMAAYIIQRDLQEKLLREEVLTLREKLAASERHCAALQAQLDEARRTIEELEGQIAGLTAKHSDQLARLSRLITLDEAARGRQREHLDAVRAQLLEARGALEAQRAEFVRELHARERSHREEMVEHRRAQERLLEATHREFDERIALLRRALAETLADRDDLKRRNGDALHELRIQREQGGFYLNMVPVHILDPIENFLVTFTGGPAADAAAAAAAAAIAVG